MVVVNCAFCLMAFLILLLPLIPVPVAEADGRVPCLAGA